MLTASSPVVFGDTTVIDPGGVYYTCSSLGEVLLKEEQKRIGNRVTRTIFKYSIKVDRDDISRRRCGLRGIILPVIVCGF